MFYPVDSLKRGGRFYLCWVADSWPLRFLHVTQRQLWSQDIRTLCDDLLEVIKNESGRPTNRFSLRLSSQLMRGLVRIYQKKVTILIGELCMLNANVFKHSNKKWNQKEKTRERRVTTAVQVVISNEAENDQRVEELIQNSGNVVSNIEEITLKESVIPDFQVPNDGFGEENVMQQFQQLTDMSIEMMLVQDQNVAQHSGTDLHVVDNTEKSHDKSRLLLERPMERISELDMTLFRKSTAADLAPPTEIEKDIPEIPEIPHIPPPEIPAPEKQIDQPQTEAPIQLAPEQRETDQQVEQEQFERLEEIDPQPKRRRLKKLIVDKKIKLPADYIRARIADIKVELRCEDFSDDIIDIRVPTSILFRRPCHAGSRATATINWQLSGLFERNFEVIPRSTKAETEMEEILLQRSKQMQQRSVLATIPEEELIPEMPPIVPVMQVPEDQNIELNTSKELMNVTAPRLTMGPMELSDLPTQKLETLSQKAKRVHEDDRPAKRQRSGYISYNYYRHSQELPKECEERAEKAKKKSLKIPEIIEEQPAPTFKEQSPDKNVTAMLQEAGLADMPIGKSIEMSQEHSSSQRKRKSGSESTETQLGSLDRTKVSLGESVKTTDTQRFIRDHWGTEGTMIKILTISKDTTPVTVPILIARGPVMSGIKNIIAARCFASLLKLKQHGFIKFRKNPETLEIIDIKLGPKFDE